MLALGVRHYHAFRDLKYADRDASEFADRLKRQEGVIFGKVQVNPLLNEQATKTEIEDGIETGFGDRLPRATSASSSCPATARTTCKVTTSSCRTTSTTSSCSPPPSPRTACARPSTARSLGLFFLAAPTAAQRPAQPAPRLTSTAWSTNSPAPGRGVVVFASSTGTQLSIELDAPYRHGAFSQALIEALDGGTTSTSADYNNDGAISTDELAVYIRNRVKALTRGDQTPVTAKPDATPDFPIAITR